MLTQRLTKEHWREIDEARARLEAFRFKVQPYPAYPEGQASTPLVPVFRPRPVDAELDQLKSGFNYLQNKLNLQIDAAKQAVTNQAKKKPIKGV